MADLFSTNTPAAPLAERLRPKHIDEVIGQSHLLGAGRPLRLAFQSGKLHSMILWGPPGVGKTTLARLMAQAFDAEFMPLSAVLSGVKDIREAIAQAQQMLQQRGRHTILFVDEVHRFNKSQQDAFLPFVEQGLVTFIGATTENPSFEVNNALLSRAQVYVLHALSAEELAQLFDRALQTLTTVRPEPVEGGASTGSARTEVLSFSDESKERIIGYADGDARRLLNVLEQMQTAAQTAGVSSIDSAFLDATLAQNLRRFDKGGEAFYDQISALHKSVRGSNPDAALTYERLGSPEGELALAQAVLYMACAPKSNAGYVAYNAARAWVAQDGSREVPLHLRNAPTKLMKQLDYGKDYRYAHDETDGYAAGENYFPDDMPPVSFYQPTERGLEAKIAEKLAHLRKLDMAAKKERDK